MKKTASSGKVRKLALLLAATGTLVLSSGFAVLSTAGSASAAKTPVNICHATNSDTNPYTFITVDDDSAKFQAHLAHRNSPNKIWKTAGTFNGQSHAAGQAKPDLIASFTDDHGVFHAYDGNITAASCVDNPVEATADVDFTDPSCANLNTPSYDTTGSHVTWSLTGTVAPNSDVVVTATAIAPATFSGGGTTQDFPHHFTGPVDLNGPPCKVVSPPDDATANVVFTNPTCANANTASYTPTGDNVTFAVTDGSAAPGEDITVTATATSGHTFTGGGTTKDFTHHFTDAVDLNASPCVDVTPPDNTPVVNPPSVNPPAISPIVTPTVVEAGLVSTVVDNARKQQGQALMGAGLALLLAAGSIELTAARSRRTHH